MQSQSFPARSNTWVSGFAMFSMLFGAGNIVFSLAIGQYAQDQNLYAMLGLLITAVGVPFLGLIAMTLFDGDYKGFFERMGKVPGFLLVAFIMGLIGPFGAIPRCVALTYSTTKMYLPSLGLPVFSIIACCLIFLLTFRRTHILDIVGYILTPLKLGTLLLIILVGYLMAPVAPTAPHDQWALFIHGLKEGYQTMDLLGAFFFCSVVLVCLKKNANPNDPQSNKRLISQTLKASCIGAALLAFIYIGFSFVAAFHSDALAGSSPDELIAKVSMHVLGPYGALIVCLAVSFACLTTSVALSTVFAEFVHKDVTQGKVGYVPALIGTLAITFFVSTLQFTGIAKMLAPILQLCYPALIVLCIVNILYKLYQFKPVKVPVLVAFGVSALGYLL